MPIFDQGYQHFHGQLTGNAWRWLVITRHGVRTQLKNRAVRILLLFAWIPALALVATLAVWGLIEQKISGVTSFLGPILSSSGLLSDPVTHRRAVWTLAYSYFFWMQLFLIMLLVVAVGPGLISCDLRFNALPLYFSRPIRRLDYFLGKLGVIGALVAAVAIVPAVLAYVMGVCFSLDVTVIRDTYRLPLASIVYGLVIVICVGTLMLALSSLTRRSILVGISWFGIWVIGGSVADTLGAIQMFSLLDQTARASQSEPVPPIKEGKLAPAELQAERAHREQAQQQQFARRQEKMQQVYAEAARTNWRPLFSFRLNLQRIGEGLLGSDAAWVDFWRALSASQRMAGAAGGAQQPVNERFLADSQVPQYPWIWSAGVLAAICALSVWTLTFRVKTLDRLK
jgi:ABC-2 type transport system permease protein